MKYVSVNLTYVTGSLGAIGFEIPEALDLIWIPRSQIRNHDEIIETDYVNGDKMDVEIPDWLAVNKGLDPFCEELDNEESR